MNHFLSNLEKFRTTCEQEETDKRIILQLTRDYKEKIFDRETELFHITASGFTINEDKTKLLMVHHNIYNSWSWIGGHADKEADLLSVALREVQEETGVVNVEPLMEDIISVDILTTIGHFKRGKYVPPHLHLNITYFLIAREEDPLYVKEDENSGVKWINIEEIEDYVSEEEMKKVYLKIINKLAKSNLKIK